MSKSINRLSMKSMIILTLGSVTISTCVPPLLPTKTSGTTILQNTVAANAINNVNSAQLTQHEQAVIETINKQTDVNCLYDINAMNAEQLQVFTKLAMQSAETLNLPTQKDTQSACDALLSIYDSKSDNFGDLAKTTESLIADIDANHTSILDPIRGAAVLAAPHGAISVGFLGMTLDFTIAMAVGGSIGALGSVIKNKGRAHVSHLVKTRIQRRLTNLGLGTAVKFAMEALEFGLGLISPGNHIARYIDSRDRRRNNGWIELW